MKNEENFASAPLRAAFLRGLAAATCSGVAGSCACFALSLVLGVAAKAAALCFAPLVLGVATFCAVAVVECGTMRAAR